MNPTIKTHRGHSALTTGIGALLLALATVNLASAQTNTGGVVGRPDTATSNGTNAGASILSGTSNSAYGSSALQSATSGSRNTAVGSLTLKSNKLGTDNTAVGYGALTASGTGAVAINFNTALGSLALSANTSGARNTAVGYQALFTNTAGGLNVAIGDGALLSSNGSGNIAIGEYAGTNLTTGSNNIYIGNPGGVPGGGTATESGIIRIGSNLAHANTYIAGIINGDGSGLIKVPTASLTGTIATAQIAGAAVGSAQVATGALGITNANIAPTAAISATKIAGGQVVKSLNLLTDAVTLMGSPTVTITKSGNTLTFTAPGTGLGSVTVNSTLTGNGTTALPLGIKLPLSVSGTTLPGVVGVISAANTTGNGIFGSSTSSTGGNGVYGNNPNGTGVAGTSNSGFGLFGSSTTNNGVYGSTVFNNTTTAGVVGESIPNSLFHTGGKGVIGKSAGFGGTGVWGSGEDSGVAGTSSNGRGVSGSSTNGTGVYGITSRTGPTHAGIFGENSAVNGNAIVGNALATDSAGVAGIGDMARSTGVFGRGTAWAGYFQGDLGITGRASFGSALRQMIALYSDSYGIGVQAATLYFRSGDTFAWFQGGSHDDRVLEAGGGTKLMTLESFTPGNTNAKKFGLLSVGALRINGADLAEPFEIATKDLPKGSVVVIDEENPGQLKLSDSPYDKRVAGILSGANGIRPGIFLSQEGFNDGGQNVALSGRVYVQADASNGPIKPGDMLTTSDTPGHAMKATDHDRAQGAIIGKAMSSLEEGTGMVLVLVTLQ